jgi:ABC-type transporter MlaC component
LRSIASEILRAFTALLIAATFALAPAPVLAAQSASDPTSTVRQVVDSLRKLRTTTDSGARATAIASIDRSLALEPLCQQALGAQWSKLDGAERQRFVNLVRGLLHKVAYPKASEFFSALKVDYRGEQTRDGRRIVDTAVMRAEGGEVSIDYVCEKIAGRWMIRDILLDRQSLADNVAGQMQAVLKQGSYRNLVNQMETRLKQPGS